MNTSLLVDTEYKNIIINVINEEVERYKTGEVHLNGEQIITFNISDQLFFDTLKMSIRGRTIAYSSRKNKNTNMAEKQLESKIKTLEDNIFTGIIDSQMLDELEESKEQLKQIRNQRMKGVMIRDKANIMKKEKNQLNIF